MEIRLEAKSTFINLRMSADTYDRLLVFFGTRATDSNSHEVLQLIELLTAAKLLGNRYYKAVLEVARKQ